MPCVPTAPASRKRNNKQNICNLSFPFDRNTTPVKGAQNLVSVYLSSAKTFDTVQKKPCALKYAVSQHKFTNSLQNATKLPTCATQISKVAKGITNAPNLRQAYCNKKTEAKNASVFTVNLVLLYKSQFAHGNSVFGSCVKQNNSVATATSKNCLYRYLLAPLYILRLVVGRCAKGCKLPCTPRKKTKM